MCQRAWTNELGKGSGLAPLRVPEALIAILEAIQE